MIMPKRRLRFTEEGTIDPRNTDIWKIKKKFSDIIGKLNIFCYLTITKPDNSKTNIMLHNNSNATCNTYQTKKNMQPIRVNLLANNANKNLIYISLRTTQINLMSDPPQQAIAKWIKCWLL